MSNNWKNKILNHEETPPDGVWDSISKKLDADEAADLPGFAARLNEYTTTPPADVWNNIEAELENVQTTVISKGKLAILYRSVAVAASVLIIVAVIILLNNKKTAYTGETIAKNLPQKTQPVFDNKTQNCIDSVITPVIEQDNIALHIKKRKRGNYKDVIADDPVNPIAYTKTEVVPVGSDPFAGNNEKIQNTAGKIITDLDQLGAPNTYVMASLGPNGETVRVSTKLSGYINYLNDKNPDTEEYLDKIIKESAIWKARLKQWSDKLINNTVSPSVYNYFDVFELSNLLDEKKK